MSRLLVVDWDFFLVRGFEASKETLVAMEKRGDSRWFYDWGHREAPLFIETMWPIRAAEFMKRGLPLPALTGEQRTFWDRFDIDSEARVYVGESNVYAVEETVFEAYDEVWLYDAHHDCGYKTDQDVDDLLTDGTIECGSWMAFYWAEGSRLHVRYPTWCEWRERENEMQVPEWDVDRDYATLENGPSGPVDAVFICRSGAWMPPWVDINFVDFVRACPSIYEAQVIRPEPYNPMVPRKFDLAVVEQYVEMSNILMERARAET